MEKKEVTNELHFLDYWRVISSRKEIVLAVTLLVILSGAGLTIMLPKKFRTATTVMVRQDALDLDVFERQYTSSYNPFFLRTQYEVIKSKPILYKVIQNLGLRELWSEKEGQELELSEAFNKLTYGMLNVEQYRDTSLISIQVSGKDRKEIARIANEIANVYKESRLSLKSREIRKAIDAMRNELQKQQDIVNEASDKVEEIRKRLGINILGQGIRADEIRLQQLEGDRIAARVDMFVRKARLDELVGLSDEEVMNAFAYIIQDQTMLLVRQQLMEADVNLQLLLENYGQEHPEVRRLKAAREKLQKQLASAVDGMKAGMRVDYQVAYEKYQALEEELGKVRESDIDASGEKIRPFLRAQEELDTQLQILNALRSRVAQEKIEQEVPRTPVEIIENAEPPLRPYSPNYYLNIALSVVLGLMAGISLAYFVEYLDTSVKTVDDIERHLDLPVIGIIPQKVKPLIEEGPDSPHAESYRVLRTNMQFANDGVVKGTFAVMSGGVGEGKSTTLFNMAYISAQQGGKVLIVDSDMRRPVQHKILGVSNEFGLTNVLLRDVSVDKAIKETEVPNLYFLPSGRLPRASLGILDSERMKELVATLKSRYDVVFFDSPPIMGVSDASILASEVDGILFVVQYRKYPKLISARAKRLIENVGGKILGVVLNNINILRDDYYYYYQSYYSHYYDARDNRREQKKPKNIEEKIT